jgi:hypothetical protein
VTKEEKDKLSLGNFVTTIHEAILARTHLMREWAITWVLAPLLIAIVLAFGALVVLDAFGKIHQMRAGLLVVVGAVLGAGVLGSAIGLGFGWLFARTNSN